MTVRRRIAVINPNTTAAMTESIGRVRPRRGRTGPPSRRSDHQTGPASIESHYDEALAVPGLLAESPQARREGATAT